MSREKIFNLRRWARSGADASDVAKGHPDYYQDMAERLAAKPPARISSNQFGNPDNPAAHEHGTGPEILEQMAEVGDSTRSCSAAAAPAP